MQRPQVIRKLLCKYRAMLKPYDCTEKQMVINRIVTMLENLYFKYHPIKSYIL